MKNPNHNSIPGIRAFAPGPKHSVLALVLPLILLVPLDRALAATYTWDGGSTSSSSWGGTTNWVGDPGTVTFDNTADFTFHSAGAARLTNFTGAFRTIRSITFNANADAPVLINLANASGSPQDLLIDAASGTTRIVMDAGAAASHTIAGPGFIKVDGGTLYLTNNSASGTLTVATAVIPNVGRTVSVLKAGIGRVVFEGVNSYQVMTTVTAGTLALGVGGSLASTTIQVNGGATFDVSGVSGGFQLASGQTLTGNGTVLGPVTVGSGAFLSVGGTVPGTLTVNNNLTLSGTTSLRISKGGAPENDLITGVAALNYGRFLALDTSGGGALADGDAFKLFNASSYSGSFASITPVEPAPGLAWNTADLTTSGTLRVIPAPGPLYIQSAWADPSPVPNPAATGTVHVVAISTSGLPLTYAWTKVSGPGTVNFITPAAADSDVSFSTNGTFVLRVTVTDTVPNLVTRDVTLVVNPYTYPVTYNANGADSGTIPAAQLKAKDLPLTLAVNSGNLARNGYTFGGWNTFPRGTATDYAAGGTYTSNTTVTLFAKWNLNPLTISNARPTNNLFGFQVGSGAENHIGQILGSSNLVSWLPLYSNSSPSQSFFWTDPASGTNQRRFYRTLHEPLPQHSDTFFPRGVYWPGENLGGDWALTAQRLQQLQQMHVNAIWLTHQDAVTAAQLARYAASNGIYLVASLSDFDGSVANNYNRTDDQHLSIINGQLGAWGAAPPPISWGLGDEPDAGSADYQRWVSVWRNSFPTEPTTAVHKWNQIEEAQTLVNFNRAITCDTYPFMAVAGYPMGANKGLDRVPKHVVNSPSYWRPWMMVSGFQHRYDGPAQLDSEGNYEYLAGGMPQYQPISISQARWQAWKSVANGAKGVFFFSYIYAVSTLLDPTAPPSGNAAAYPTNYNTGRPPGLIYHTGSKVGQPGPAFIGASNAYAKIEVIGPLLSQLDLIKAPEAWLAGGNVTDGKHCAVFRHPQTQARYVLVVAGYNGDDNTPANITFKVGPHITALTNQITGAGVTLSSDGQGARQATLALLPGEAEFFACTLDPSNMPVSYYDDFEDNKHRTDSLAYANVNNFANYSGYGRCLGPTSSSLTGCYVEYDLNARLGALPANGLRVLRYDGDSTLSNRGAFWWKSDSYPFAGLSQGNAWSANRLDGEVSAFTSRYVRVAVSRSDAADYNYGNLKWFGIVQWPNKAP